MIFSPTHLRNTVFIASLLLLSACSPKFDWREVRSETASYIVALPTKPTTYTRKIDLKGIPVSMTMIASTAASSARTVVAGSADAEGLWVEVATLDYPAALVLARMCASISSTR